MSRKKKFIEKLSNQERITLEQGYKYGKSPDFRLRCQVILLSNKGFEINRIEQVTDLSRISVSRNLDKWAEHGISGLIRRKGQGRKARLSVSNPTHVQVVKEQVAINPQQLDQLLEPIAEQLQLASFSKWTLQRFLKRLTTTGSDSDED